MIDLNAVIERAEAVYAAKKRTGEERTPLPSGQVLALATAMMEAVNTELVALRVEYDRQLSLMYLGR